jgi:hypothetical protein
LRHRLGARRHVDVELGTVAGGQDQGLFHAFFPAQLAQRLAGGCRVEGDLLAQADRRGEVIEPEGDQRHGVDDGCAAGVCRLGLSLQLRCRTQRAES